MRGESETAHTSSEVAFLDAIVANQAPNVVEYDGDVWVEIPAIIELKDSTQLDAVLMLNMAQDWQFKGGAVRVPGTGEWVFHDSGNILAKLGKSMGQVRPWRYKYNVDGAPPTGPAAGRWDKNLPDPHLDVDGWSLEF